MSRVAEWYSNLANALQAVTTIVGVVAVVIASWAALWTWIQHWDWVQRALFSVSGMLLLFLISVAAYAWWRKTKIYQIPKLLYGLDALQRDYVDTFDPDTVPVEDVDKLAKDLGELMHIGIYPLGNAFKNKNKNAIATQTGRYSNTIGSMDVKNNSSERLKLLMQIGALMDEHNMGLKVIKDTPQYQRLFKETKLLERIQPNPYVSIKIDNYFRWSEGWYSQLIGMKFITSKPDLFQLSPAEYRATVTYSKPVIEDYMDVLIAGVAESLQKGKGELAKSEVGK